ncbi:MAG TPA: hypothetical protein DC049_10925, partial [Spirochaetia bacterium]|nr:hypothetical protein [Spirochaetia bacterium]
MTKQKLPKLMLICITLFTLHMIYAAEKPITLVYAIGIRDGAKGTDGVTFKVEVSENGKKYNLLGTTHYKESAWKFLTADLSKYRDNKITIRLSIDPGESTACDWAGWGDIAIAEGEVPKNFQGDFKNSSFKTIVKLDTIGFTKGIVTKNGEIPTFDADSGGIFNVDYIKCAGVLKHGFFSHPCWKEEYKGSGVFAEFKINNLSFLDTGGVETHSDNKEFSKSAFSEKKNYAYPPEIAAWNTETKNEQIKKAEKFLKDFNAATTRKDKKFIIQPGDYRFDDELKQQLVFSNAVNMEIIADGVTFWIEESGGIKFVHCFNVSVKGLTIDYDPLPFTQAVIVDINQTEQCLIVRIIDGFPSPEKYPSSQKPCFTPDGKFIPDFFSDKIQSYESVGDKTIRIKFLRGALFKEPTKSLDGTRVKDIIVINPRRGNTIRSVSCGRMTFEDITLYASSGFGFAEGADAGVNAGGNVYRKCKIVRRPGTKRFIGCNADAFHSIEAVKGPLIEDCEFSWSCDDFVNIHGFFAMVYAAQDSTHLKI